MAANGEQLSPEEKLLRVIQGGSGKGGESAESPGAAAAAPAPAAEEKPKLKLSTAKKDEAPSAAAATTAALPRPPPALAESRRVEEAPSATASEAAAATAALASPPASGAGGAAPRLSPVPRKKNAPRAGGIVIMNRCLAAAVVVIVALIAMEIWASARGAGPESRSSVPMPPGPAASKYQLPPRDQVVAAFTKRGIFDAFKPLPGPTNGIPTILPGPLDYASKNLKLIALSALSPTESEAIVMDRASNRTLFMKAGQQLALPPTIKAGDTPGKNVTVRDVRKDGVILKYEDKEVTIK